MERGRRMKIYIASHEIGIARILAETLREAGHTVTSSWIEAANFGMCTKDEKPQVAATNERDVEASDVLVLISGPGTYPGGKFIETGYAMGLGKRVICLGRLENTQMYSRHIEKVMSVPDLVKLLGEVSS